jgi:hypothetical protein
MKRTRHFIAARFLYKYPVYGDSSHCPSLRKTNSCLTFIARINYLCHPFFGKHICGGGMERPNIRLLVGIALLSASLALAQDSLVGTYTGNYLLSNRSGDTPVGLQLIIESVENGVVKGTARLSRTSKANYCAGEYPVQGTYRDNTLKLRSSERSGIAADCGLSLNLKQEGNKLTGTRGSGHAVELTKS